MIFGPGKKKVKKPLDETQKIHIIDKDDAEKTLRFIEMILKLVYEFPAMVE